MKHAGTVPLFTERLVLRRYTMDDVDAAYHNWMSDPAVTEHVTWERHPDKEVTAAVLQVWTDQYANDFYYHWGIEYDGELIGDIAVVMASEHNEYVEIGYCLGKAWWGQGLMSEALARVVRFMFETLELHRVFARHDVRNVASGRVMQKVGLLYEGKMRGHFVRKDGTWADQLVYGMLRDDWIAQHADERRDA